MLIGPSGCGKTTALKMVNRLISITDGDITIDGQSVRHSSRPQLRRGIGYVFQQIGLFPHMTVESNIGAVPAAARLAEGAGSASAPASCSSSSGSIPRTTCRRYPGEFSGGQQQRIGVARAMAADPPIMLMDEPFGAIDPIARDRLQNDFLRLHRQVRKTVIFVTHDIDEAIKMGDRIAIMRDGRLVQLDTPGRPARRARRRVRGRLRGRGPRPEAPARADAATTSTRSAVAGPCCRPPRPIPALHYALSLHAHRGGHAASA